MSETKKPATNTKPAASTSTIEFLNMLDAPNGNTMTGRLMRAIMFAAEKHQNQVRKGDNPIPYINHPLMVMNLVNMSGITDVRVLSAAVLHDTVEDTSATLEEIEKLFGKDVASMVDEVSDDKALSKLERKQQQVERVRNASSGAKLIKIADKISNCLDVCNNPPSSWKLLDAQGYICWSKEVVKVATEPESIPNTWLVNVFDDVCTTGLFLNPEDSTRTPILPSNEEECLKAYYNSLKK